MKKILSIILNLTLLITIIALLLATIKGNKGNPLAYQNDRDTKVGSPYEASNTSSRYALTEGIVKNGTFFLNEDQAKFAAPDLTLYKGKFMTLFTPGVSFIAIPLYFLGEKLGYPQLITFLTVPIFAIVNFLLIMKLARRLGASFLPSFLSGFLFLFGTNALSYSQTLSQHHISVTIILSAILVALGKKSFYSNILFGLLLGIGLIVDIPNLLLLTPVAVYHFLQQIDFEKVQEKISFTLKLSLTGLFIGLLPIIALFAFYNYQTTGSYTKLAQSIGRTKLVSQDLPSYRNPEGIRAIEESETKTSSSLPFNSRKQLNGFYTLLISNERAWIFYGPVVFIGILGLVLAYRQKALRVLTVVAASVIAVNIVVYSMFGDPWGGWAFGPRYLIPAAAISCMGIGVAIDKFRRNLIFVAFIIIVSVYSISVNTIGVLTTSMIAPRVEAVNLPDPIPYTYEYNLDFIKKNMSSSLIYNLHLSDSGISVQSFIISYATIVSTLFLLTYLSVVIKKEKS